MEVKARPWGAIAFIASMSVLVVLYFGSVMVALPATVLTTGVSAGAKAAVGQVIPQGWSFFTRDPQSKSLILVDPVGRMREDQLPQTLPANMLGLSRNQRSQDTEKAAYSNQIVEWTECGGMLPEACLEASLDSTVVHLEAVSGEPNFCGEHLLVAQRPTPFLFRKAASGDVIYESVAHIDIDCGESAKK